MLAVESNDLSTKLSSAFVSPVLFTLCTITKFYKYFVSSDIYRESTYPPYVSGGGFVISASVARKILSIMPTLPPMPIDDAFLGLCLKRAGLTWRLHNNRAFKESVNIL